MDERVTLLSLAAVLLSLLELAGNCVLLVFLLDESSMVIGCVRMRICMGNTRLFDLGIIGIYLEYFSCNFMPLALLAAASGDKIGIFQNDLR